VAATHVVPSSSSDRLPHVHQHLLDDVALGALEAIMLGDGADDAVEGAGILR
jgi:hypothetical protein